MIQASDHWVYDRRGGYKTVSYVTEYVSPEIGELLFRDKRNAYLSILVGLQDLRALIHDLHALASQMEEEGEGHE